MLSKVDIIIDQLPVIRGTPVLSEIFGYPLLQGEAKETAGGMLMAVANDDADDLLEMLEKLNVRHFEIGHVTDGKGNVDVLKNAKIIES